MTDRSKLLALASEVMPAIKALEGDCTAALMPMIERKVAQGGGMVRCTEDEWDGQEAAFGTRDAFFAAMMPTERDAIEIFHAAFHRLKALGWREAIYCPKDGSSFDAIEPGSTGIHNTSYQGEWPTGSWWIDGDSPSRPCLYRPTEAEERQRKERIAAYHAAHAEALS
ncbi:hypothetical protein [Sphingomonas sp.]|uniref:hypothetical protein n=1 Tax=Sphingomonas sp. TaxID=28214 RepID=UPI000DBC341E|nr:hypothetical protein [Sphingomonas sp.]PZT91958.1 MAG: hypothetical protein DI625_14590 [Sphingomonas sp.]